MLEDFFLRRIEMFELTKIFICIIITTAFYSALTFKNVAQLAQKENYKKIRSYEH